MLNQILEAYNDQREAVVYKATEKEPAYNWTEPEDSFGENRLKSIFTKIDRVSKLNRPKFHASYLDDIFKTENASFQVFKFEYIDNVELKKVISEAEEFLSYEEDWDDDGAKPFKKETLERAEEFLIDCDNYIFKTFGYRIKVPEILPGEDGSFKIFWDLSNFQLLMTIPENASSPISYYGEDSTQSQVIEGKYTENRHAKGLYTWIYEEMKNASV